MAEGPLRRHRGGQCRPLFPADPSRLPLFGAPLLKEPELEPGRHLPRSGLFLHPQPHLPVEFRTPPQAHLYPGPGGLVGKERLRDAVSQGRPVPGTPGGPRKENEGNRKQPTRPGPLSPSPQGAEGFGVKLVYLSLRASNFEAKQPESMGRSAVVADYSKRHTSTDPTSSPSAGIA